MKKIYLILIIFAVLIGLCNISKAAEIKKGIENFPDSYKPYLEALKEKYPNWEFSALYTGLDFNQVISNEYRNNRNLVPISYSDIWKCTDPGIYNVEIDKGWVNASKRAVEYTMDPRNFINEIRIFCFEKLSYDTSIHTKEGIEKILYGTEFYQRKVSYKTSEGKIITTDKTYSDLLWDSAIYSGVSPYHLASRMRQELGAFVSHPSISGNISGYEGLYNFYNIGATSSSEELEKKKNGLSFARDGKGASEEEKQNLFIPWNTPERAIKGGAVFIGRNYINVGQNTLYLQKFAVNTDYPENLFWHQYMTNCLAPYSESMGIYKAYKNNGVLDSSIGFLIPVYENMPEIMTESPDIIDSDFTNDNTKMYANVTTTLNIRTGPGTQYEILKSIPKDTIITRIKKGIQSDEIWDKIKLENGMVGYVFSSYLKEVPKPTISGIELSVENEVMQKGSTQVVKIKTTPEGVEEKIVWLSTNENIITVDQNGKVTAIGNGKANIIAKTIGGEVEGKIEISVYTAPYDIILSKERINILLGKTFQIVGSILPEDASQSQISWKSENENIATVTDSGLIEAKQVGVTNIIAKAGNIEKECEVTVSNWNNEWIVEFAPSIKITGNEISGLENFQVSNIQKQITTNLEMSFADNNGNSLEAEELVGTGSKLILSSSDGTTIYEYEFLIYGDVNGDGLINALDVLVLQKHILETKLLEGIYLKTGNISKNGDNPSALDVLKLQKHILEIKFIEQ